MDNDLNKKAFISGKLSGTRSLESDLKSIENPDDIEMFLLEFINIKFDFKLDNKIIYINDDQDFLECMQTIENNNYISIYPTNNFSRLYVTSDNFDTYVIRLNKISVALISSFIAKDKPIKFILNSFSFIKWCIAQGIDIRNIYDIPTYIKLLTNKIDPYKNINNYIEEYSNYLLDAEDNELNAITICNLTYELGKYLNSYSEKFNLETVCKLINENSYFEGDTKNLEGNCKIYFSYSNIHQTIDAMITNKNNEYKNKAYVLSPLGRIAIKYGNKIDDLLKELYYEDITLTVLNELYNNNIHVTSNDDNDYLITCKLKNFNSVISLLTALLNNIFLTLFDQSAEISLKCIIKE